MNLFTAEEVWTGGFYELAMEFDPDAETLTHALTHLCSFDELDGCYLHRDVEPTEQPRHSFAPSLLKHGHLLGVATIADGNRVACGTCTVREDDGPHWLDFYLPMSALGRVYPVGGFPIDQQDHEAWRHPLDDWLTELGRRMFERVPFRMGLIGFEVSGCCDAAEISTGGVPAKRYIDYLLPDAPRLEVFRRNERDVATLD